MRLLDKKTGADAVRLLIFILVTTIATGFLVVTIGNISFAASTEYKAVFSDATGVVKGDDVRVAGVKVGNVESVEVVDLGGPDTLSPGATIPMSRTRPALDLPVLFNGFKPLFEALSPADINKLSYEIVTVFQGEGGTLESLLSHTASVTSTLASRDQVIGSLITNLNEVMVTIGNRDQQLSSLLVKLRQFVSGLSQDRQAILGSLDSISGLAVQTSDLVTGIRPSLTTDVKQLRSVAGNLDRNKAEIDRALQVLPVKLTKVGRTATYGSFFNFYLCNFKGNVKLGKASLPIDYPAGGERCDLG